MGMKNSCLNCGSIFDCISIHKDGNYERKYKKKFCSRKCAASRCWDDEKRARHSEIAKKLPTYKPVKLVERTCPCGKNFMVRPCLKKKHCCYLCSVKYVKRPPGGYREGSGRSKSGYYKGIYCGSTYELCWVIYQMDKGLPFKRFEGLLEKNGLKYYPDFLVSDKQIVEIKGYWTAAVDQKTKMAESLGYSVAVLYKEDLKPMFSHVEEKYGTKKFQTLYDDHKPNYVGTCFNCKKEFSSERRKPKTEEVFCSRSCCGKYRKIKNTPCR
jgi:hypothetical protein